MKKCIITMLQKNADKTRNRIVIPKWYINKFGHQFYMSIEEDGKITLTPIKFKKKGE